MKPDPLPLLVSRRLLVHGAVAVTAGFLGAAVGSRGGHTAAARGPARWPAHTYPLIDGRSWAVRNIPGRAVIVHFWATRCQVCMVEMPDWVALYERWHPRGLDLLAVAMPFDRPDWVVHAAKAWPFPVALDPRGEAVVAWGGVPAIPASWLVAPDGRVVHAWEGRLDVPALQRRLARWLPPPA